MIGRQLFRFGGICGILLGIINLLTGAAYLLLPAEQKLGSPGAQLLPSVAQSSTMLILLHAGFTLLGLFGIGLVPALTQWVSPDDEGWLRWSSRLAMLGYGLFAAAALLTIDRVPRVAQAYVAGDASTKAALLPVWRGSLDPFAIWGYGVVGLWILLVSLAFLRSPRAGTAGGLALLGVLAGIVQLVIPLGFVLKAPAIFAVVSTVGNILVTLWYLWSGVILRRSQAPAPAQMPVT